MPKRGNGQGSIIRERNRTYTAVATSYASGTRETRKKRGFLTKLDASRWLAQVCWANPVSTHAITFSELFEEWIPLYEAHVSTKRGSIIRGLYKRCSRLYNMRWTDVGLRHMQMIINEMPESFYPRRDMKVMFSLLAEYAVQSGYSDKDLTGALKLPQKTDPHKEPFTPEEVELLWCDYDRTHDVYTAAALVMIYTGMRVGELVQATPDLVHLADGYMMGGRKTKAGKEGEIILVPKVRPLVKQLVVDGGLPRVSDTAFRKHYEEALARAGTRKHTIHECRHTTATALALAGVQPAIISAIMRHTSYQQTLDYTHVGRGAKLEALSASVTPTLHPAKSTI